MISERKFSNSYTSFWSQLLPTAEVFVRQMNLTKERFCKSITAVTDDRNKRSVINEVGFRLFGAKTMGREITKELIKGLEQEARDYIERLIHETSRIPPLSVDETAESECIAAALAKYFGTKELSGLRVWPMFQGCGQLDACKGDIIDGFRLIEVKAGERNFRVVDVRQVITYLALNFASKQYALSQVAFVNPRTGMSYECGIDSLVVNSSGRKPVEVFEDIIEFVSSETNSK